GWSRSGNSLSFSVDSDDLGSPGPARLLARTKDATQQAAPADAVALRSATVRLELAGVMPGAEAVELRIRAQSRAGVPNGGWVDVSDGAQSLASSPLLGGVATVPLPVGGAARVLARYHSDDPWWQPGEALQIELGAPAAQEPARWPWLVLLAPIG